MSDCNCSPLPDPSCNPSTPQDSECGRIRMFFGYQNKEGGKPGELNRLYKTPPESSDSIKKGFTIPNYSAQPLVDSGIIKTIGANNYFNLTEAELLASETWEGWLNFSADWIANSGSAGGGSDEPFGIKCMRSLDIDMDQFKIDALIMFASLLGGDTSVFFSKLYNSINMPIDDDKWGQFFQDPDPLDCKNLSRGLLIQKLKICWEWFKNIQETYYGKQFLVKVAGGQQNNSTIPGICIKDEDGNDPVLNKPFYIDGDGSSQGYYTSDEIVDGGFPKENANDILGLTTVDWVQNTDGKISSFVKIGKISDGTDSSCVPALPKRKIYYRFLDHEGKCVEWIIDLSKLDINNYYIHKEPNEDQVLYMKCEIENKFYVDDTGTWINITLSEKIPLILQAINPIQGITAWYILCTQTFKKYYYDFLNKFDGVLGSRGNSSQLNLAQAKEPCLIPQGVVIPLKSNVYNYGPYYYVTDPDEGGGIELIRDTTIAPQNFIEPGEFTFPVTYPYCAMDKFGKELAKLTAKGLQKLEKGRANVVGLPCHTIGKSLNTDYDDTKEIGPTLLTDINVDYGPSGFNTTYNFSTYSPRLGKSEKYLLDAWSQNIEKTKYINNYLRNEKTKVEDIKKGYNKKIIDKNYYFNKLPSPKIEKNSTPSRLMFSGYYFTKTEGTPSSPQTIDYPIPENNFEPVSSCDPSSSPTSLIGEEATEPSVSDIRRYTFSEIDQAYSAQYIQNTYFQLAGMSLDGFYLPISLRGVNDDPSIDEYTNQNNILIRNSSWENAGRLPRFAMRCEFNEQFIEWESKNSDTDLKKYDKPGYPIPSKTRDEIPPFFMKIKNTGGETDTLNCYLLPIHQRYLNPFTTKNMLSGTGAGNDFDSWDDRKGDSDKGFVISSIVFGQNHMDYQISHTNSSNIIGSLTEEDTDEYIRQQYHNFRTPSLRGPLVLQGWGYDTTGKPIPNSADRQENTELGQFKKSQLTDKFLNNWLENPKTWPVGPVDLRFDRERGVWTCASPNKIIAARLKEDLECGGSAKAELINPEAGGIRFYEKYHISGPNGENVKLNMSKTEITVYDFLGEETIEECSKIYVYYDDNRYIVLRADKPTQPILRFRVIKLCKNEEDPSEHYEDQTWGKFAGYGDKYYNYHIYGIRIDCDGDVIDKDGKSLPLEENEELNDKFTEEFVKNNAADWLIKLQDNAGKFGPSYAHFEDYDAWKEKAATGYALRLSNKESQSCDDPSSSESPTPSESAPPCLLGETSNCESPLDEEIDNKLKIYDIIFIESYARFLHGCLTEDLYPTATGLYNGIEYKQDHLYGNAAVDPSGLVFYGDAPNGKEPIYLDKEYQELPIRVFDPWIKDEGGELKDIDCYTRVDSIFYNATSGTPFTAIFNEKDKKYYIWQINKKEEPIIRFKIIKFCDSESEDPSVIYDDNSQWGEYAGYGDKYHNYHTYGIRIDCDGNIIDSKGKKIPADNFPPTQQFLIDNSKDWLVRLQDNAGRFGPSYAIFTDYEEWNDRAATGYAALIKQESPTSSPAPAPLSCSLGINDDNCSVPDHNRLSKYDIIFIESYARFIHGCLTQDLYLTPEEASNSGDSYKAGHGYGNAAAEITHYYGDAPNGKEPIYLDSTYQQLPIRVFDPWLDDDLNPISCYNPEDSHLFSASSGTPFTAVFNEKQKKYYITQIPIEKEPSTIRFKLIDFCTEFNLGFPLGQNYPGYDTDDSWTAYAGFGDKFPNKHILGVRINCDGQPVNIKGKILTKEDFFDDQGSLIIDKDIDKAKSIFINLLDTVGNHGPAHAIYYYSVDDIANLANNQVFDKWMELASTGFATICEIKAEGTCSLGENTEQCSNTKEEFKSYDILFIDTYARFVECELTQDLYVTTEEAETKYSEDEYKKEYPEGNAAANLLDWYGDSPNGKEPKFFDDKMELVEFRVFDPFKDAPEDKNPFLKLKYGDRVLAILNENLKKYIIWQSLKTEEKVVKFALTADKQVTDIQASGVFVDRYGRPIDKKDKLIEDQENFSGNFITIIDPYVSRTSFAPNPNGALGPNLTAFGPALGSDVLQDHYDGIRLAGLPGQTEELYERMPPFLGFALERSDPSGVSNNYEMFCLESYAKYVKGKICSKLPNNNQKYKATLGSFKEGIKPVSRGIPNLGRGNLLIHTSLDQFTGVHSAIGGDLIQGATDSSYNNVDGCEFVALLDSELSTTTDLVYNIVESERFALEGKIKFNYQIGADKLNDNNDFKLEAAEQDMESEWYQGFIWNKQDSQTNFELVKILNRAEWIDKGLFIKGSIVTVYLSGFDNDGNPIYSVDNGGTIARMVQRYVSNSAPGLFGLPGGVPEDDRKVDAGDDFADGLDPSGLDEQDKPKIDMSDDQQWMTYDQGIVTGLWDETLSATGKVADCKYKIVYAQEAPVIMTCKAQSKFTPENHQGISLENALSSILASCQGADRDPIPNILQGNVFNPMGHGAEVGDFVTIQRVFVGSVVNPQSNYKYIVIGTGKPPE